MLIHLFKRLGTCIWCLAWTVLEKIDTRQAKSICPVRHSTCQGVDLGHFIMANFFLPSSFSFLVIASARGGVIQFNSIFNQTTLLKMVKTSLEGNCFMYF